MIKVLFVCHGNICRSPMAEFVLKDMVKKAGLSHKFHIASCAASREELGSPMYSPARRELTRSQDYLQMLSSVQDVKPPQFPDELTYTPQETARMISDCAVQQKQHHRKHYCNKAPAAAFAAGVTAFAEIRWLGCV